MEVRIYRVNIEHRRFGFNWNSRKVVARDCEDALKKVKRGLERGEKVESVQLLEHARASE